MENSKNENIYNWESFCKVGKITSKPVEKDQSNLDADAEKENLTEVINF